MTATRSQHKRNINRNKRGHVSQRAKEWGSRAAIVDRRREVWALRARGLSYRAIAEQLGIDVAVAWNDCKRAEDEWGSITDDPEIVRQQLLAVHTQVVGSLMQCLERQAQQGQVTEARDADGQTVGYQVRHWISPQSAAEVGRSLQRIASLFGLGNATDPDQPAAATSTTSITLISPGSAAEFGIRAQELAAARAAEPAPIDVSVAQEQPEAAQEPPEASAQPEPPEAPSEPILEGLEEIDVQAALARVAAERAAMGNGSPRRRGRGQRREPYQQRVLPPPVRN